MIGHDLFQQAKLVIRIKNIEISFKSDQFRMTAKKPDAYGMEGAKLDLYCLRADDIRRTLLHLVGSLVCEGNGENLPGANAPAVENMGEAGYQHPGFAGAGPGKHQDRPLQRLNGRLLAAVQAVEILKIAVFRACPCVLETADVKSVFHGSRYRPSADGRLPRIVEFTGKLYRARRPVQRAGPRYRHEASLYDEGCQSGASQLPC